MIGVIGVLYYNQCEYIIPSFLVEKRRMEAHELQSLLLTVTLLQLLSSLYHRQRIYFVSSYSLAAINFTYFLLVLVTEEPSFFVCERDFIRVFVSPSKGAAYTDLTFVKNNRIFNDWRFWLGLLFLLKDSGHSRMIQPFRMFWVTFGSR